MIRGTKARLRALEHDDLPRFVKWINDPELRAFLTMRYPLSLRNPIITSESTRFLGHPKLIIPTFTIFSRY